MAVKLVIHGLLGIELAGPMLSLGIVLGVIGGAVGLSVYEKSQVAWTK